MNRPAEFAQSGIAVIPKGWKLVSLKEIAELKNGERPLMDNMGSIPIYGANGIMGQSYDSLVNKDYTIIIGRIGASGEIYLAKGKIWVSDNAIYTNDYRKKDIFLPFLYFLLLFRDLGQYSTKTTHPIITQNFLKNFRIILPPYPEQKKIAEVLSTVDQAIEKVGEAIEKTQRLKKGLMQELLTKGIGHKEFKDTEIRMIPKNWGVRKIEEISLDFVSGGTPSTPNKKYWNGDIPWMTSAFITEREIRAGQRYITKEGLKNSATNIVPKDNLVVATRVGIGKAAINRIDLAISQDLTGVIIDKKQGYPEFLYWALTNSETKLKSLAQGSTIKRILREGLGKIKLPLPPLPEQQKIAEILASVDKRLELLREKKERLQRTKKGLMNDLLTGKRRVRLDSV